MHKNDFIYKCSYGFRASRPATLKRRNKRCHAAGTGPAKARMSPGTAAVHRPVLSRFQSPRVQGHSIHGRHALFWWGEPGMVKKKRLGEGRGGCMVAHFMEERTDAARRRRVVHGERERVLNEEDDCVSVCVYTG